jgi:hypothetical protein
MMAHCGLFGIDDQLAVREVVSERNTAPHPHPLLLRGGKLVANPLARYLPLKLGEGEQHVQREPAHGRGGIELLGDRNEAHSATIEGLDDPAKIIQSASQTVYFVNNNGLDLAGRDVLQETLESRATMVPPEKPPSSYRVFSATHPSCPWLAISASHASR